MKPYPDTHHDLSSNTIFGFWVYLMTDCVMFASFFAAYAVLQGGTFGGPAPRELLDLRFALYETIVLLMSSFAAGVAMLFAPQNNRTQGIGWYAIAFVLGLLFLGMQATEFSRILSQGYNWKTSAFLSSYFTLVGLHSLHIVAGMLLMILFAFQLFYWGFTSMVLRRLTCLRIYWQFIYLIWIFTFAIVYLIGAKYTEKDSKIGRWPGGAPNLGQALPALSKLNLKSLPAEAGPEFGGCPTQAPGPPKNASFFGDRGPPEPIFQSREV